MKKITLPRILLFALLSLCMQLAFSQQLLLEMPLQQQVNTSDLIIEGRLVDKTVFRSNSGSGFYTVNKIEVYKVFKGSASKYIELVTPGGFIGNEGLVVTPSLKVYPNETGMFFLRNKDLQLQGSNASKLYASNGNIQGMMRYDVIKDAFISPFKSTIGITSNLYSTIQNITKKDFETLKNWDIDNVRANMQRIAETKDIISITPLTSSGGTNSILTISGSGFLNTQGTVLFPNADTGGMEIRNGTQTLPAYLEAYDSHIVSWTDTEILVEIPSYAGTGPVRVTNTNGVTFESDVLTINYAHLNITLDEPELTEYTTQFYGRNGDGGYDWKYNTGFNSNTAAKQSFERAFYNWVCSTGVNWVLTGTTAFQPQLAEEDGDGVNVVGFRSDFNGEDINVIAYALSRFGGCDNASGGLDIVVVETDMVFNSNIDFNYGPDAPVGDEIDFETVAAHELGHAHQLDHIIDADALMHFSVSGASQNRIPDENDITGAIAVFNRSANNQVCSAPLMTASECSLSTDDLLADSILVYPNPARNVLNIKTTSEFVFTDLGLYDALGRKILGSTNMGNSNLVKLNITSLNSGIYYLKLKSNNNSVTKKIIME